MSHLANLSPAETLLILEGSKAPLRDLLKYTFMDLLLKKVLKIIDVTREALHPRDHDRVYKYLTRGKNFTGYFPKGHEYVFLGPFDENKSIQILFKNLVRIGYQKAGRESGYRLLLTKGKVVENYFSRNFFQQIVNGFSLNSEGLDLKNKIAREIAQLEKELPGYLSTNKAKALELVKTIGGNIFLLKGFDLALLDQFDKEFMKELHRDRNDRDSGCSGCT